VGGPDDGTVLTTGRGYIRGGGGIEVSRGRLVGALLGAMALALLVVAGVLGADAAGQNSRADRLHASGVAVDATVSGCVALASGTGITAYGYRCRATFSLDGRQHEEMLGGTNDLLPTGQTLAALTLRDDPGVLYTASSVDAMRSTWTVYVTPALLALLAVVLAVLAGYGWRRRAHRS
jgi:hypothetical protein